MKKKTKVVAAITVAVIAAVALILSILGTADGQLDVIAAQSAASFQTMLAALPGDVQADETTGGWSLLAPDGEARFAWNGDSSGKALYEVALAWNAQPFVNAGLDTGKLPKGYSLQNGWLLDGMNLYNSSSESAEADTPLSSYRALVSANPGALGYHAAMDHFGISTDRGNTFEWARDIALNAADGTAQQKDIVFALNPEPLIAAGVNPAKVEGWTYATVEIMRNNETVPVERFLKSFDLK